MGDKIELDVAGIEALRGDDELMHALEIGRMGSPYRDYMGSLYMAERYKADTFRDAEFRDYGLARAVRVILNRADALHAYLSASKAVPVPVETITELQNALVAEIELARTRPRGDLVAGLEAMGRTAVRRGEAGSVQIIANAIVAIADASPPKTYEDGLREAAAIAKYGMERAQRDYRTESPNSHAYRMASEIHGAIEALIGGGVMTPQPQPASVKLNRATP